VALRTVERLGLSAACGFIHVPLPRELRDAGAEAAPSLADLVAAVKCCIAEIAGGWKPTG